MDLGWGEGGWSLKPLNSWPLLPFLPPALLAPTVPGPTGLEAPGVDMTALTGHTLQQRGQQTPERGVCHLGGPNDLLPFVSGHSPEQSLEIIDHSVVWGCFCQISSRFVPSLNSLGWLLLAERCHPGSEGPCYY